VDIDPRRDCGRNQARRTRFSSAKSEAEDNLWSEDKRPATQPIMYVDGEAPPMLLLRPGMDDVVDPGNSARLAARIAEKGGTATLKTYERVGHLSLVGTFSPLLSFLAPARDDFVAFVLQRGARSANPAAK
jgi:dipeptidyl aminopeptidase/acylaminoacyl peptidase